MSRDPTTSVRRYSLAALAASAIAAVVAILLIARGDDPPETGAGGWYVDPASLGGRCSDDREASEARSTSTPWCSLGRAVEAAPAGATVLLRRSTYPAVSIDRSPARKLRVRAFRDERAVLTAVEVGGGGVRLEGLDITGTVTLLADAAEVAFVGNSWITDGRSGGTNLDIEAGVRRVLVERNTIAQGSSADAANAINFSSTDALPPIKRVTIRDNRIGPMGGGGDAIQAKNTRDLLVEGNEIFGLSRPAGSASHPDAFQSIYGAVRLTLRGNFIHDIAAQGVFVQVFRGPNRGFRAEDNVIARVAYPWVAFSFAAEDARVVHNTIGGLLRVGESTRRAAVVANIAGTLLIDPAAQLRRADYNLVGGVPQYRDVEENDFRLDPGSLGSRQAPGGRDIGSRRANWSKPK